MSEQNTTPRFIGGIMDGKDIPAGRPSLGEVHTVDGHVYRRQGDGNFHLILEKSPLVSVPVGISYGQPLFDVAALKRLDAKPGDVFVLTVPDEYEIDSDSPAWVSQHVTPHLNGAKVILLPSGATLEKQKPDEKKLAALLRKAAAHYLAEEDHDELSDELVEAADELDPPAPSPNMLSGYGGSVTTERDRIGDIIDPHGVNIVSSKVQKVEFRHEDSRLDVKLHLAANMIFGQACGSQLSPIFRPIELNAKPFLMGVPALAEAADETKEQEPERKPTWRDRPPML